MSKLRKAKAAEQVRVTAPFFTEEMEEADNLAELLTEEETIAGRNFLPGLTTDIDRPYLTIRDCIVNRQTFINCRMKAAQVSDVRFVNCDLSNLSFAESSFYRAEFISCKLVGTNLSETTFNHVWMDDCNGQYINLSVSKMNQVRFSRCDFQNGTFTNCKPGLFEFDDCRLVEADFSHTALRGVDLRTSRIEGIQVSIPDLRGAVINYAQAMDLMPLLGVVIKD